METKIQSLLKASEFNRFGLICVVLTIVGCLGGVTVGLGAVESVFTLSLVVLPTMLTLSMIIAVAPMRYILGSMFLALGIDLLLITYFLIQ